MRQTLLACVALVAFAAATPATLAFEIKSAPTNADGSAKFIDPDRLTDSMANSSSGRGGSSTLHFGSTTVTVGHGGGTSGMSPALQDQLMLGPSAPATAASPWR